MRVIEAILKRIARYNPEGETIKTLKASQIKSRRVAGKRMLTMDS